MPIDAKFVFCEGWTLVDSRCCLTSQVNSKTNVADNFRYDEINRLVAHSPGGGVPFTTQYVYDQNGLGRLTWQENVGDYSYEVNKGRDWIHSVGASTYEHDAVGNIIDRNGPDVPGGTQHIEYTAFDLPSKITSPGSEVSFAYDARGRRVVKQGPAATIFYLGDAYQLTETPAGQSQRFMIYAGGRAVAQLTNSPQDPSLSPPTVRYLHDDRLGSVDLVTDTTGTVSTRRSYSPFGQQTDSPTETPYGFTGHEDDEDVGLINMRGRMYDPKLGQFLSADPLLSQPFGQGLNRFAYVNNSPLNFTDPSGFSSGAGPGREIFGSVVGVGAAAWTYAALGSSHVGALAAAVASPAAIASPGAAAFTPLAGVGSLGGGALSIGTNDLLFSHPQPTHTSGADGLPAGGGHTGAAPGRGAVPNDAIAPSVERGALVQERPQRFSLFHRGALAQVVEAEIEAEGEVPEEEILREEPEQADFAWGAPTEPAFEFRDPELAPVESPDVPCRVGIGFRSFTQFKRVVGPAGPEMDWHHIVEQTEENLSRFGPNSIHNTGNLLRLDRGPHRLLSGFYSSIQPQVTGSMDMTVRQWLAPQSMGAQQDFGLQIMIQLGISF